MIRSKVLAVVTLPPPHHGQAEISKEVVDLLPNVTVINTNFTNKPLAKKFGLLLVVYFKTIIELLFGQYEVVYFTPSRSLLGSLKDIPILFFSHFTKKKIVAHVHGADLASFLGSLNGFLKQFYISSYQRLTSIIVPHRQIARDIEKKIGLNNCNIVENYIHHSNYEFGKKNNAPLKVLFFSNILYSKGIREFVELVRECKESNIGINAEVAGAFMENALPEKKLVMKAEKEGLLNYLGFVQEDKKKEILAHSDILVFPSHGEAFPLTILEAMTSGTTIISSNKKYHKYLIDDTTGYVVDFKNIEKIKNIICQLNDDRQLLSEKKLAASKYSKNFNFDKFKLELEKIFENL